MAERERIIERIIIEGRVTTQIFTPPSFRKLCTAQITILEEGMTEREILIDVRKKLLYEPSEKKKVLYSLPSKQITHDITKTICIIKGIKQRELEFQVS